MHWSPLRKRTWSASTRYSTQGPLAVSALPMRCSAVSGRRAEGSKGADAGDKARIASRERVRFSGLGGSGAAGALVAALSAAWLGALGACGAGDAAMICATGLAGAVSFVSAARGSAAGGGALAWGTELPARAGSNGRFLSGKRGVLIWICKGGNSTSTVGAKRGDDACGLGVGGCKPCKTQRKPRCSNSTSATLNKRKRLKLFNCASCP
jgi:hypothetical protein